MMKIVKSFFVDLILDVAFKLLKSENKQESTMFLAK